MIDDYLKDLSIRWLNIREIYFAGPTLIQSYQNVCGTDANSLQCLSHLQLPLLTKLAVSSRNWIKYVWQKLLSVRPCWLAPVIFPSFNVFVDQEQKRSSSCFAERSFSYKKNSPSRNLQTSWALSFCAMYLWTKKWSMQAAAVMARVQNIPADWDFKQTMFKC